MRREKDYSQAPMMCMATYSSHTLPVRGREVNGEDTQNADRERVQHIQ